MFAVHRYSFCFFDILYNSLRSAMGVIPYFIRHVFVLWLVA